MKNTIPVFILGTGRSGSLQMAKMLERIHGIQSHHEYLFENILKTAVLFRMGIIEGDEVKDLLKKTHLPAINYSTEPIWVDSSNALPWIIGPLYEIFPNARFIHLVRDGRKVVSSFYHKFTDVMYHNQSVKILREWLANRDVLMEPPPEKKYWRPLPSLGEKYFKEFNDFSQFQRLCYYWQDCNISIHNSLKTIPEGQKFTFKLEDVVHDATVLENFLAIFGLDYEEKYLDVLKKPVNVSIPQNYMLTEQERAEFNEIAGDAMRLFGYGDSQKEYTVAY
jgi:hypothetical protein